LLSINLLCPEVEIIRVVDGEVMVSLFDNSNYVQGVAWDPQNQLVVSQSCDRTVNVYQVNPD
jgi:chromatin assembly factor 1 subunit B